MSWFFADEAKKKLIDTDSKEDIKNKQQSSCLDREQGTAAESTEEQHHNQEGDCEEDTTAGNKTVRLAQDEELEKILQEAICLHAAGVEGDKEAVSKAHALLEKLYQQEPENPVVAGYYGSILTLLGRDAVNPLERLQKTQAGLKVLDNVLKKAPDNIQVRLLRGNVCYRLPERYFQRLATAIEDFKYLAARYEEDNNVFSAELYEQIIANLKQINNNMGQARDSQANPVKKENNQEPEGENTVPSNRQEQPLNVNVLTPRKSIAAVLKDGSELHARALAGNKQDRLQALEFFAEAYQMNPTHQLITAYYADCLTLMGFYAKNLNELFASTMKAIKLMDNAVNIDPDDIQVRFLRAYQSLRLPEAVFHRTGTAIGDFRYLLQRYEQDNSIFNPETYRQILFDLAIAYRRLEMDTAVEEILTQLPASERDKFIQYSRLQYSFNRL